MSAQPQYCYIQGDEYLLDMRLRHQDSPYYPLPQTDGLARDLRLLSLETQDSRHLSGRSCENQLLSKQSTPSHSAKSNDGLTPRKSSSNETNTSASSKKSSSRAHSAKSNPGLTPYKSSSNETNVSASSKQSSSQASRHSTDNDHRRQLDRHPTQLMLDRWLRQTTKQEPFHGLADAK